MKAAVVQFWPIGGQVRIVHLLSKWAKDSQNQ